MTTSRRIPFTEKEKTIIGDFIHSIESDTLIISECNKLVEALASHNLITNKQEWLDKIKNKVDGIVNQLKQELKLKVSPIQGSEIMAEYYGQTLENTDNEQKERLKEEHQNYRWGVGNQSKSEPFDNVKIGDSDFELIHGEFPHSRQDNTTYARSKENPEIIYDFSGHRLPFKIEIEESNYLKSSGLSGDEIRKSCIGKLFLNNIQIFECGGRTYERAFKNIQSFIDSMEEHWSWFPNNLNECEGKIIKYEGQLFKIERFIVSQACMILVTPDGKPRKPFQSEIQDFENNDFDGMETLKVEINSERIWWYPTKKEIESCMLTK